MTVNYDLYLVTEETTPLPRLLEIVEEAVKGGVTIVQLREKKSGGKVFYEKAKALKKLLAAYEIPLIINDRVDVALAVEADGVHIGQSDLPVEVVRAMLPSSMIVGLSVSTVEEAEEAAAKGADYIGIGSVFPTESKDDAEVLEEGMISKITKMVDLPAVAIGGIQEANLNALKEQGLSGISVVSAIMKAKEPKKAARSLKENWHNNLDHV